MADDDRTPSHAVAEPPGVPPRVAEFLAAVAAQPYAFDFFHTLRRLDALHGERPRLGESARLADDVVRLGQVPELIFAPSTMAAYEAGRNGGPPRLSSYFFGAFGPNGALPVHLTEYARDRIRNAGDRTFARFVDVFHHRMLSLFYRAWAASQPTVAFDRPHEDRFAAYVASLFGLGMPSLRDRDAMPDLAKLHFSGRLANQTRNAEGLRSILADYFKLPVEIEQFVGDWVRLPRQSLCMLGRAPETGTLGSTASIGERIHVYHHKFRILFGPIGFADYARMLPGGLSLKRLVPIVRNYVGDEFVWDVNLVLLKEEVPQLRLGKAGLLGWTTWLGSRRSERDAADLLLNPYVSAA